MTYLKCKLKTDNIRTKSLPIIFLPKLDLNTDLITTENLVRIIQKNWNHQNSCLQSHQKRQNYKEKP